jgi:cation:H+ antiporter
VSDFQHWLPYQISLFTGSLVLVSTASYVLTAKIEKFGVRLGFSKGLLGIIAALSADSPEITSAIMAMLAGHNELGVGVVLGSNLFNLAALLGLSTLLVGEVRSGRESVLFDGGAALLVTLIGALLVVGLIPPWLCALLVGLVVLPYFGLSALHPRQVRTAKIPPVARTFLARALAHSGEVPEEPAREPLCLVDALVLVPLMFAIISGSRTLVHVTTEVADRFSVPHVVVGMLAIGAVTGVPNAIAAYRFASRRRGAAVVSETFNSNTLNIMFGACLPALFGGVGVLTTTTVVSLCWLVGMTILAIVLLARQGRLRRAGASSLVAAYAVFVVVTICSTH